MGMSRGGALPGDRISSSSSLLHSCVCVCVCVCVRGRVGWGGVGGWGACIVYAVWAVGCMGVGFVGNGAGGI